MSLPAVIPQVEAKMGWFTKVFLGLVALVVTWAVLSWYAPIPGPRQLLLAAKSSQQQTPSRESEEMARMRAEIAQLRAQQAQPPLMQGAPVAAVPAPDSSVAAPATARPAPQVLNTSGCRAVPVQLPVNGMLVQVVVQGKEGSFLQAFVACEKDAQQAPVQMAGVPTGLCSGYDAIIQVGAARGLDTVRVPAGADVRFRLEFISGLNPSAPRELAGTRWQATSTAGSSATTELVKVQKP